jgi:hypothetical protein
MKKFFKLIGIIIIVTLIGFSMIACNKSGGSSGSDSSKNSGGGGKSVNSAEELKEYLDKQPANSPDNPIKVSMTINDPMLKSVADVIKSAGKYVSLNITGNALTEIPNDAFWGCETLVSVTIPNTVTRIENSAFLESKSLTSVTIPNSVTRIGNQAFYSTSLNSITIPSSITNIGAYAFFDCTRLTSVTFQGSISSDNFGIHNNVNIIWPFGGDLHEKYLAGGIGTYTTTAPVDGNSKWTKQ